MKHSIFRRACALIACMVLCFAGLPAEASDTFLINVDVLDMDSLRDNDYVVRYLSAQASGIRIQKYISDSDELAARIRVTVVQMDTNTLVFDKNYGYQGKTFDSDDIYLPYVDNRTVPYLVTLYVEDWVYAMPFMHLPPRLYQNGACLYGVRMQDYNPSLTSNWLMGTMLDLNELRMYGQTTIPVCASNAFIVGEATVSLVGEQLSVFMRFKEEANVELHYCPVYLVPQVASLTTADPLSMVQPSYAHGQPIDVTGVETALLYVPMSISYNASTLEEFGYDLWNDANLQYQLGLWQANLMQSTMPEMDILPTPPIVVPEPPGETPVPDLPMPGLPMPEVPVQIAPPAPPEVLPPGEPTTPEILVSPLPAG